MIKFNYGKDACIFQTLFGILKKWTKINVQKKIFQKSVWKMIVFMHFICSELVVIFVFKHCNNSHIYLHLCSVVAFVVKNYNKIPKGIK